MPKTVWEPMVKSAIYSSLLFLFQKSAQIGYASAKSGRLPKIADLTTVSSTDAQSQAPHVRDVLNILIKLCEQSDPCPLTDI